VQEVFGMDLPRLEAAEKAEFDGLVTITRQFSRTNPDTGDYETISPRRVAAIPAITERHVRLLRPARGELGLEEILDSWCHNMPENDGLRHPDHLFDMAQMNFGTDRPIEHIEHSIMRAELRRRELEQEFRSTVRQAVARYRYERSLDGDASEEELDAFIRYRLGDQ